MPYSPKTVDCLLVDSRYGEEPYKRMRLGEHDPVRRERCLAQGATIAKEYVAG